MVSANKQTCSLCDQLDGAVVSCTDCDTFFHPSCAWLLGYKFGFEFALGSLAPVRTVLLCCRSRVGHG